MWKLWSGFQNQVFLESAGSAISTLQNKSVLGPSRRYLCESFPGCLGPCHGGSGFSLSKRFRDGSLFRDCSHSFMFRPPSLLASPMTTIDVPGAGAGSYQGTGCPGCFTGLNQFGLIAGSYSDSNSVNPVFCAVPTVSSPPSTLPAQARTFTKAQVVSPIVPLASTTGEQSRERTLTQITTTTATFVARKAE